MRTQLYILTGLMLLGGLFSSCSRDKSKPFLEYAPQMYHSIPLNPYKQTGYNPFFPDNANAQAPVPGTVARGKMDYYYPYPATMEGYNKAGAELTNPVPNTRENRDEGKRLYGLYCKHCHGKKGAGDGPVAEKISTPPPYNSARVKALKDGHMYHSITYGYNPYPAKGMGPHGSQLEPEERWKIIHYIKTLRGDPVPEDTLKTNNPDADAPTPEGEGGGESEMAEASNN